MVLCQEGRQWKGHLVAHEVLHSIDLNESLSFVIKLDMMKAYDKLNWSFLFKVLRRFGSDEKWFKWIKPFISVAFFSVIMNGFLVGYLAAS